MSARDLVKETNGLINPDRYHAEVTHQITETVSWADKRLAKIVRLRLVSDPGFPVWDVSYCHGQLKDGSYVNVDIGFSQIPKKGMRRYIVERAKEENVYARGLGVFDAISTLI